MLAVQNDRCRSIWLKFSIPEDQFKLANPGIDCTSVILTATMVCLELGAEASYVCDPQQVQANETCDDLLKLGVTVDRSGAVQPLTLLDVYRFNPGIRCDALPISGLSAPLRVSNPYLTDRILVS